jgi:steroid delta-isomerase
MIPGPITSGYLQHATRPSGYGTVIRHVLGPLIAVPLAWALAGSPAISADSDPKDQVRAALLNWTADFNARKADAICDLFAPDLRYDYRGMPERGFQDICDLLKRSLSDPQRRYTYSPAIREIIVNGDVAIVRLTWTLKVKNASTGNETASDEFGMDMFRRQPDGTWKIIRYMGYEAP